MSNSDDIFEKQFKKEELVALCLQLLGNFKDSNYIVMLET